MIELRVHEFCPDCHDFDPKNNVVFNEWGDKYRYVVTCKDHNRCAAIERYIREKKEETDG